MQKLSLYECVPCVLAYIQMAIRKKYSLRVIFYFQVIRQFLKRMRIDFLYDKSEYQGLYSLSGKTSFRKISWSLEAARFGFKLFQSLWNLAGTSAVLLPRSQSIFRAIRPLQHPITRLRDFMRFDGKTSYRLVNRGPGGVRVIKFLL